MLPAPARLRRKADFSAVLKYGRRTGRPSLVLAIRPTGQPARAGFIVSKAVGNAVVRNRVKRRLRHLVAPRLADVQADIVIRALPPAGAHPDRLAADFGAVWVWAQGHAGAGSGTIPMAAAGGRA
jgi:ribonuclease P protein component